MTEEIIQKEEELHDLWVRLHHLEEEIQDVKGFIYDKEDEIKALRND